MMAHPRTVQMYLMDGTPSGRIKCSLDNWVGKVYLIPRTAVVRTGKDRPELYQTGIYLLCGADSDTGEQMVYVGQARERKNGKGVLGRVRDHIREENLDYFTHAILIIDSEHSFGPTEISYLENAFYRQAVEAGRVTVTNGNEPSPGNVTEEKEAELHEFLSMAKILIGSLGYRLFDAVDEAKQNPPAPSGSAATVEPLLYLSASGASGKGRQTADGFVVLAGARLRPGLTPKAPKRVQKIRERFADRVSSTWELTRDTLFTSPSAAARFLIGGSANGRMKWENVDGVKLRDLEEAEANALAGDS